MNYSRTLASIACLKIVMEKGARDFIDAYIPLVCEIMRTEKCTDVDSNRLCIALKDHYGLTVPYHAMQMIITRCKTKKILRQEFNKLIVNDEKLLQEQYHINLLSEQNIITKISKDFLQYASSEYSETFSEDKALNIMYNFLNSFDIELLISSSNELELPKIKNKEKFIFSNYIQKIKNENDEYFSHILKLALGNVFSCMICYPNQNAVIGKLKNVIIYIDTPFILKMIGIEGNEKESAFLDLVRLIQQHGGKIKIFEHTYDETNKILNDCLFWIDNPDYDPELASDAIKYFIKNSYDRNDVRLFISKLATTFSSLGIESNVYINPNEYKEYQIDENKLFEIIADSYSNVNYVYENWKKKRVVERDVQSISNIYRQRKGLFPQSIQTSRFLFLTTNGALVRANEKFEKEILKTSGKILPCYNDTFIGTMLWLQSPSKVEEIRKKEFLSFCMSQLQPTPEIINKFSNELKKLKKMGNITDEEFYFLKTEKTVFDYIVKITKNDPDLFSDKLPKEILEEIKIEARNEIIPKYENEKQEKEKIKNKYDNMSTKIEKMATSVANLLSWGIVIILIAIAISIYFVKTNNNIINIIIKITDILIAFSGFIFGFNLWNLKGKIENYFYSKILSYFSTH